MSKEFNENPTHSSGIALRDYFAAKAMASLIEPMLDGIDHPEFEKYLAVQAYLVADGMLAVRKGEDE